MVDKQMCSTLLVHLPSFSPFPPLTYCRKMKMRLFKPSSAFFKTLLPNFHNYLLRHINTSPLLLIRKQAGEEQVFPKWPLICLVQFMSFFEPGFQKHVILAIFTRTTRIVKLQASKHLSPTASSWMAKDRSPV